MSKSFMLFSIIILACCMALEAHAEPTAVFGPYGSIIVIESDVQDGKLKREHAEKADYIKVMKLAKLYGRMYDVDPDLLIAVIKTESAFNRYSVSGAGAEGLMQIMPETQKQLGVHNAFQISENIEAGTRYLKMMLDKYRDVKKALAAYNAGPGAVNLHGGVPPFKETQLYVHKVMALYRPVLCNSIDNNE